MRYGPRCLLLSLAALSPLLVTADARACANPRALGLSRVAEIDAEAGAQFGHQQYKQHELLGDREVVLTFDDGPMRPYTQAVLDALEAHCTKATFFMVGQRALAEPALVRDIARKGHTVATHTWSHQNLRQGTPLKARDEIELGVSAVRLALGTPPAPFFRFPYLAAPRSMLGYLQTRQLGVFSIDIDALDYRTQDPATVHSHVMSQLGYYRKGILLFHDIQPSTARALPGLLAAMKAQGFRVVHLKPRGPAATLPEFDAMARAHAARGRVASLSDGGLASRSLPGQIPRGWPDADPRFLAQPQSSRALQAGAVDADTEALPPSAAAPPPPPPPRVPRARSEPDWRVEIFRDR